MQIKKYHSGAITVALIILMWSLTSCSSNRSLRNCVVPNFSSGAKNIGISAQELRRAFGRPDQGPPDFSRIANKLGLTRRDFLKAMNIPEGASLCPPGSPGAPGSSPDNSFPKSTVTIRSIDFEVNYSIFKNFTDLPSDITVQRQPAVPFTRPEGDIHFYEAVHVPTNNISWVQAAILADSVGGYLASITSPDENAFVFSLVNDEKYFWEFPDDYTPDSHYRIKIGPFLGGTKTDGSRNSKAGWVWLSGEKWSYTNWTINLDDGVVDNDPRNNTQPNGRGRQNVMGFGELNKPVATWGDYFEGVSQYENMMRPLGYARGFVIEYDHNPNP